MRTPRRQRRRSIMALALQGKVAKERTKYYTTLSLPLPTSLKTPTLQFGRDVKLDRAPRQPRSQLFPPPEKASSRARARAGTERRARRGRGRGPAVYVDSAKKHGDRDLDLQCIWKGLILLLYKNFIKFCNCKPSHMESHCIPYHYTLFIQF